jgi:hypothetical protein
MVALVEGPWMFVSQITRVQCENGRCQPLAGQAGAQRRRVQRFPSVEACLAMRETMLQRVQDALEPINQLVKSRTPQYYIKTSTTFICQPDSATTQEGLQ